MTNDNFRSKQKGYDDATTGAGRKDDQDSWYYEGYIEGQLKMIEWSMEEISKITKSGIYMGEGYDY